jgi:hypothetical protein
MACASNSLPVPVSPKSSTGLADCAARRAWRFTSSAAALLPTKLAKAPCVAQVLLQPREFGNERLQRGLGMVEQHDAEHTDDLACVVAQRDAADHKGAGLVGQQVDEDGFAGGEHLVHLRVLHDAGDRVADKVFFALEAERGQKAAVLVVDPHDAGIAVDQHHALAGIGKQVEHGPGGQFKNALRVARKAVVPDHARMVPPVGIWFTW